MSTGGKPPWPKGPNAAGPIARLQWCAGIDEGKRAWGRELQLPEIQRYRLEAIGVLRDPAHSHEEAYSLYRAEDLHRLWEAKFVRWGSLMPEAYLDPLGASLYDFSTLSLAGFSAPHRYAPVFQAGRIVAELPEGQLGVEFPPAFDSDPGRNEQIAGHLVAAFTNPRGLRDRS